MFKPWAGYQQAPGTVQSSHGSRFCMQSPERRTDEAEIDNVTRPYTRNNFPHIKKQNYTKVLNMYNTLSHSNYYFQFTSSQGNSRATPRQTYDNSRTIIATSIHVNPSIGSYAPIVYDHYLNAICTVDPTDTKKRAPTLPLKFKDITGTAKFSINKRCYVLLQTSIKALKTGFRRPVRNFLRNFF